MELTNEQFSKLSSIADKLGWDVDTWDKHDKEIILSQRSELGELIEIYAADSQEKIIEDITLFVDTFDANSHVVEIISNNRNVYHDVRALIDDAEDIKNSLIKLKNALIEADIFADTNKVTERCPYCEEEVKLEAIKYKLQECPNCHKKIRACSLCDCNTCDCSKCEKQ